MEATPAIEQFMQDCFRERTASLKLRLEVHREYWRRYYQADCLYDSRRGVIERSEAEKIESVLPSDFGAAVITTGSPNRSRYHVQPSGGSWLIHEMDTECLACHAGATMAGCQWCHGKGWLALKDQAHWLELKRHGETTSGDELGGSPVRDPAIEQFMARHFQARAIARDKEKEICGAYAQRFFTPEIEWMRWLAPSEQDEPEHIESLIPGDGEVLIITRSPRIFRLRYHVRPEGQGWLIWQVDIECLTCSRKGRSADCFWCGGTLWDRKTKRDN